MTWFVILAAIPFGYCLARAIGLVATQRQRLRLADLGESFLMRADVDEEQRSTVQRILEQPTHPHAVLLMIFMLPLFVVVLIFIQATGYKPSKAPVAPMSTKDFNEVFRAWIFSSLGSSPILSIVFLAELIATAVILVPLGRWRKFRRGILQFFERTVIDAPRAAGER